jgi:hypothetical protein
MLNKVSDYFEQDGWERLSTNSFLGVNFDLVIRKKWAKIPWHIVFKHIPILEENLISEWDENFTRLIDELKKMKWKPKLFLVVFLVDQIPDHISKTINEDEGGIFSDTHRAGSFRITPFIADKSQKALYGRIPKIPIPAKKFSKEIIDFFTAQMNYSHTYMTLEKMKSPEEAKKELMAWGVGLIVLGGIHLSVELLSGTWGIVLIAIGILNFIFPKKFLFIVNGIGVLLAGILNLYVLIDLDVQMSGTGWYFGLFALLQIFWGIKESLKFRQFK